MIEIKLADIEPLPDGRLKSRTYDDIYFSCQEEARYVFIDQTKLKQKIQGLADGETLRIGELGFGTGLNFFLVWQMWESLAPENSRLVFISTEKHPLEKSDFENISKEWPTLKAYTDLFLNNYPDITPGIHTLYFYGGKISLNLYLDDAKNMLNDLSTQIDIWFLDGFVPTKNPDMWTDELFSDMARLSHKGTVFSTFTAAGHVRRGLEGAGFQVEKVTGFGPKRNMLRGAYTKNGKAYGEKIRHINIIGAGIAGCALAYTLSLKGYHVNLYDQHSDVSQEASNVPISVIYPKLGRTYSDLTMFHLTAFRHTRNILYRLGKTSGFTPCGVLTLDTDEERSEKHKTLIKNLNLPSAFLCHLCQEEATKTAGILLDTAALWCPSGGIVDPKKLCASLLAAAGKNLTRRLSTKIEKIEGPTIIACGTASNSFPETTDLPLESVRGQISLLPENKTSKHIKCVINHKGHITPAQNGAHVIGSTFTRTTEDVTSKDHAKNFENVKKHLLNFNSIALDSVSGWVGYRAVTPDRLPLIGIVPGHTDLYILSGLGAHGYTTALLGAEIIAAMLSGDPLPVPKNIINAVDPVRFARRQKKKA